MPPHEQWPLINLDVSRVHDPPIGKKHDIAKEETDHPIHLDSIPPITKNPAPLRRHPKLPLPNPLRSNKHHPTWRTKSDKVAQVRLPPIEKLERRHPPCDTIDNHTLRSKHIPRSTREAERIVPVAPRYVVKSEQTTRVVLHDLDVG